MKEFIKQFPDNDDVYDDYDDGLRNGRSEGWKTALEWVQDLIAESNLTIPYSEDVLSMIEKELEQELNGQT